MKIRILKSWVEKSLIVINIIGSLLFVDEYFMKGLPLSTTIVIKIVAMIVVVINSFIIYFYGRGQVYETI